MKQIAMLLFVVVAGCGTTSSSPGGPPNGPPGGPQNGSPGPDMNPTGNDDGPGNGMNGDPTQGGTCTGAWALGSTFYRGNDVGAPCNPDKAPQNCLTGMFIYFDDGRCYCTGDCAVAKLNAGDACTKDGTMVCKQVANKTAESGGLMCVLPSWNLCGGQVMHQCTADGSFCSASSECCSGTCGTDGNCTPKCAPVGSPCSAGSDCCSGTCGADSNCAAQ